MPCDHAVGAVFEVPFISNVKSQRAFTHVSLDRLFVYTFLSLNHKSPKI